MGYAIRLESNVTRNTRLAYVTNGIALRMLEAGSGLGGEGTAFDELTVSNFLIVAPSLCANQFIAYHHRRGICGCYMKPLSYLFTRSMNVR